MSYRTYVIYTVVCDQCGTEDEDDEFSGWCDQTSADEHAEAHDWTATQGRHLCPECVEGVIKDPDDALAERHRVPGPGDQPLSFDDQDGGYQ